MAAGMRGALSVMSWVLLAAAVVMMFFVVLSGFSDVSPLNKTYFLQADTSSISTARPLTQWTYFYICGDNNQNCGPATAALPFGYAWSAEASGVPSDFQGDHGSGTTSTYYFYMWRFGWAFYLMGLAFGALAVFTGLLSCTRIGSGISSLMTMIAFFWTVLAAILMTVEFVKARDVFQSNGLSATIGRYAFGFTWGATVCLFLSSMLFFGGCVTGREKTSRTRDGRRGYFERRRHPRTRNTRNRGSLIDNESQRPVVKNEY